MLKNRPLLAVLAVAVIAASMLLGRVTIAQDVGAPTAIGIVDLQRVFQDNQLLKSVNQRLTAREQELSAELQKRQGSIRDLRNSLDGFTPGSEQFKQKRTELIKAQVDLQAWQNFEQVEIQNQQRELLVDIQSKIENAISEVAKQRNLGAVFAADPNLPENLGQFTPQQLQQFVLSARMPYHAESLDITQDVIARIDANFQGTGNNGDGSTE